MSPERAYRELLLYWYSLGAGPSNQSERETLAKHAQFCREIMTAMFLPTNNNSREFYLQFAFVDYLFEKYSDTTKQNDTAVTQNIHTVQ